MTPQQLLAAITADDRLLDRLGSAIPGQPTSDLDKLTIAWRNNIEARPFGELVDTATAIATIQAGAA